VPWVRRYILFHGKRHPDQMGAPEVAAFLSSLATRRHVSASTQNQALSALLFLYRHVLGRELGTLPEVPRAKRPARLPVVLSRPEVAAVIGKLSGVTRIVGLLLYGAGLRLGECLELRVKDLDFDLGQITIRRGKGQKDRVTMLPGAGRELLRQHLESVRATHAGDLAQGVGRVVLPEALARKYPSAATEWGWQFGGAARRRGGGEAGGGSETCGPSYVSAFLCDPPPGGRLRHSDDSRVARTSGCGDDDGVYARVESRRVSLTFAVGAALPLFLPTCAA